MCVAKIEREKRKIKKNTFKYIHRVKQMEFVNFDFVYFQI